MQFLGETSILCSRCITLSLRGRFIKNISPFLSITPSYGDYPDLSKVKKILVIKLRQIGDVLLTAPVFSTLKHRFPNAKITAYVYSDGASILKGHPAIDDFLILDRKLKDKNVFLRFFEEARLLRRIRKEKYDLVINLTEGDRGAIASKVSKAKIRVGVVSKNVHLRRFFTHLVKNCPTNRHTVEKNLDALRRIGIFPLEEEKELFLKLDEDALSRMKNIAPSSFVLIHPTSRWMFKSWPIEKLRELCEKLIAEQINLVFTSGPDKNEMDFVARATRNLPVKNLAGLVSLQEMGALIHLSKVLFCMDSLPFHMASCLKKPVIALFGPTSEINWGPWRNPFAKVITKAMSCRPCYMDGCGGSKVSDCLVQISVDDVFEKIKETYYSLKLSPK